MSSKHQERSESRPVSENAEGKSSAEETAASTAAPATASIPDSRDAELATLRERVASLEASESALAEEVSSLKDQYLRKLADYENFRKRMFREREESLKFANTGVLTDLVAILDDFDRAIDSAEHAKDYQVLHDGVALIRRQLGQMLGNKYGLTTFPAMGQPFDPNVHEAVASEMGDVEEPMVCQEFLPGYKLHERVIRSAKVKVRMPAPGASRQATQDAARPADQEEPSTGGEGNAQAANAGDSAAEKTD